MRTYILKRLLLMIPTLFGITLIVWLLMVAAPGRPGEKTQAFGADASLGSDPTKEREKGESQRLFRRQFALDRPVFWNGWTTLSVQEVGDTVRAWANPDTSIKEKREAKEKLEDWGNYAVPALIELLPTTTGKAQEDVLYWLRMSSYRAPVKAYGRELDAEQIARNDAYRAENVELATWTWTEGAPAAEREPVLAKWAAWYETNRDRWETSFFDRLKIGMSDTQFATYWGNVFQFNLGVSHVHKRPVVELILERLPVTLTISSLAILIAYVLAIPLGIFSAVRPYTVGDRITTVVLFLLYSLPSFFVGTVLLRFFTVGDPFDWFPNSGFHSEGYASLNTWDQLKDILWHITLPLAVMSYGGLAALSRYARTGMLDVIRSDYIRTARAKGLGEAAVIFRHAARNGMMPVVTLLGTILPSLIAGSVIVEYIFNLKGMGLLVIEAISNRDYNIVAGEILIVAALTLVGLLISDILYAVLDPRISYS